MSAEQQRKRAAARGWVSRCRKLEELLECQDVEMSVLQTAKGDCERRLSLLDDAQSEAELCFPSEADMLADIENAAEFREGITDVLARLMLS